MGLPVIISKGDSLLLPKGVDLRLSKIKGRVSGQGRWKDSMSFANWVLNTLLVHSTRLEDWEWWQNPPGLTDCVMCPVKWVPRSLWRSVGIPQVGKIFSRNILLLLRLWLCGMGMLPPKEKTYKSLTCTWQGGSWLKSICQISKRPKGKGKYPKKVWMGFPGWCFEQIWHFCYN